MEKELAPKAAVATKTQKASSKKPKVSGLPVPRYFTTPGVDPGEEIAWELRSAGIQGEDGKVVFEQKNIEVPKSWSMLATNVVASKYFRGTPGTPDRETSVRKLIARVVDTITAWGQQGGYFAAETDRASFQAELTHLLLHQKVAFNSPVWFNVGVEEHPQCSACFINSVEDSMDSILTLAKTEGMLFKYGSGTGSNLSSIRSSKELLAGGGTASGPVSFMKGFDAFAGVIKSGGKTRRAAKMVILNADHPDVLDFVKCKDDRREEGLGADRRGLRLELQRRGVLVDLLPELEQLGARHRRLHEGRRRRQAVVDPRGQRRHRDGHHRAARAVSRDLGSRVDLGDPGLQFDTTINAGTPARAPRASTPATPAASTCSSTTPPATWRH